MSKQNKSKEYTRFIMRCEHCAHKMECKVFKGDEEPEYFGCNADDISFAFGVGWDAALENQWVNADENLPDFDDVENISEKKKYLVRSMYVGTENEVGYAVSYMRSRYKFNVETDRVKVIAWMPIPSFDEILKANKDVLKRLKDK